MSSSIFSTGVRGVTHFRTTSGRVYVTSSAPNALQVLAAVNLSNLNFVTTSSGGLGVVNLDNTSGISNWIRINGSQLFVHCCNASNFGAVKGVGWNASNINNRNTCLGIGAGQSLLNGTDNTIIGHLSGKNLSGGSRNTIVGAELGYTYVSENDNILFGSVFNSSTFRGNKTMVFDTFALANASSNNAIMMGFANGNDSSNYYENYLQLSYTAGAFGAGSTLKQALLLGNGNAIPSATSLSNTTFIRGSDHENIAQVGPTFASNQFSILSLHVPTTGTGVAINITTSGQVVRTASAKKYKTEVSEYNLDSNFIYDLSGKFFYLNADEFQTRRIGYFAEDLMNIPNASNHVICDINCSEGCSGPESIDYYSLLIPVIEEMKKLDTFLTDVETRLTNTGY